MKNYFHTSFIHVGTRNCLLLFFSRFMLRMINVLYNLRYIYHVLGQSWLLQITNIFPQLFLIPDEHEIK